ncbi:MAG: S8 family serine peptidase [Dysgonamonadaceae bacterium]|jgi:subtilisin family serine protease|nr:S8 family serine peptidase [Dysgonamonadaceae bacterium]
MKNWLILIILTFLALNGFSQIPKSSQNFMRKDGKPQIKYADKYFDVDTTTVTIKVKDIQNIKNEYKVIRKNKLGFVDIQVPDKKSIEEFTNILSQDNFIEEIIISTWGEYIFIPDDPNLSSQWHLSKINVYDAWDITMGSPDVIVGILDSGTEWTHSDLGIGSDTYQNIYLNPGEDIWTNQNNPATGNGIDDDNNGFIDDWKGWNFANNSNDSRGTYFHGTFVAGIVGAKTNNSNGIAGVAGGNNEEGTKLLSYCVGLNAPVSSVIDDAIIAAVDNGTRIIQFSLTVSQSSDIDAAIQYAVNQNVIIVCASGNSYSSSVSYPASNPNVIAVGATNQNNQRADFSNYGNQLDLVAPGVDIYSTTLNNTYTTSSGTSFAAPQVSAIAALVLSVNPYLTGQQVRDIIESTAQKVGSYNYQTTSGYPNGTWNNEMGYGLVDAYAAVQTACAMPVNFTDQTVTTDTTVTSCGDIYVQNVTVTNGAKLTLDAAGETTIEKDFEVELGSELKIK